MLHLVNDRSKSTKLDLEKQIPKVKNANKSISVRHLHGTMITPIMYKSV